MDLYAEDLTDYIYQENDVDKKTGFTIGSGRKSRNLWRTRKGKPLI